MFLIGERFAFVILMIFIFLIVSYIYFALALMSIAKRTNTKPAWLAWIPYANIYLISKIARQHWWPMLLVVFVIFINFFQTNMMIYIMGLVASIIFIVFMFIWGWKICEIRGKPGWWTLLILIPLFGKIWIFILIGILAWGKDRNS